MFDDLLSGPQTILEYCGVNHTHLFIVKPFLSGQGPFNPQYLFWLRMKAVTVVMLRCFDLHVRISFNLLSLREVCLRCYYFSH